MRQLLYFSPSSFDFAGSSKDLIVHELGMILVRHRTHLHRLNGYFTSTSISIHAMKNEKHNAVCVLSYSNEVAVQFVLSRDASSRDGQSMWEAYKVCGRTIRLVSRGRDLEMLHHVVQSRHFRQGETLLNSVSEFCHAGIVVEMSLKYAFGPQSARSAEGQQNR